MKVLFETDRLIAREFLPLDASNIFKLNSDKKILLYTGDVPFKNKQQAEHLINQTIIKNQYKKYGFGRWAIHLKANGLFIGWCGLRKVEETQNVDLGFRFHKRFWNKGFATEVALESLHYGFNTLNLDTIIARVAKENLASIQVLEKIGMQFQNEIICHSQPALLYKIENL